MLDIKCFEIKERSLSSHLIQFKFCFFIIQGALYRECPTDQIKTLNLFDYAEEVKFLLKNGTPPHSWVIKLTHDPLYICVYVHARACVYSHIYVYKFIYIHQLFHLLSCLYHMRRYMWITGHCGSKCSFALRNSGTSVNSALMMSENNCGHSYLNEQNCMGKLGQNAHFYVCKNINVVKNKMDTCFENLMFTTLF